MRCGIKACDNTASTYRAEPAMVRIAGERTRAIVRTFLSEAPWKPLDFMILAESCYMQGLNDMCDAAIRNDWEPVGIPAPDGERGK